MNCLFNPVGYLLKTDASFLTDPRTCLCVCRLEWEATLARYDATSGNLSASFWSRSLTKRYCKRRAGMSGTPGKSGITTFTPIRNGCPMAAVRAQRFVPKYRRISLLHILPCIPTSNKDFKMSRVNNLPEMHEEQLKKALPDYITL